MMNCENCERPIPFEEYIDCDTMCRVCYSKDNEISREEYFRIMEEADKLDEEESWLWDDTLDDD